MTSTQEERTAGSQMPPPPPVPAESSARHDSDERPVKRPRLSSKLVTVNVGTDPIQDFFLHEDIITKHSEFFKAALDKKWKEGRTLVVDLPEDDIEVFSSYAEWLYNSMKLPRYTYPSEARSFKDFQDRLDEVRILLAKMYVFGEKVRDGEFCDAIVNALHKGVATFCETPNHEAIKILYEGTPVGSPGRKFLVDAWIAECDADHTIAEGSELPPDFIRDVANGFIAQTTYEGNPQPRDDWYKSVLNKPAQPNQ